MQYIALYSAIQCNFDHHGSTESKSHSLSSTFISSLSVLVSMAVSLSVSNSANIAFASSSVTCAEVVLWKVLVLLSSLLSTESDPGLQYEEDSVILLLSQFPAHCHFVGCRF